MLYAHCDHSKAIFTLGFWASAGWSSQVRYPPYEAWPCVEEGGVRLHEFACDRADRIGPELTEPLVTRYPESECIDVAYMLAMLSSPYIIRRLNILLHGNLKPSATRFPCASQRNGPRATKLHVIALPARRPSLPSLFFSFPAPHTTVSPYLAGPSISSRLGEGDISS